MSQSNVTTGATPQAGTIFSAGRYLAKAARYPYGTFFTTVFVPRFGVSTLLLGSVLASQLAYLLTPVIGMYVTAAALVACMAVALRSQEARTLAISVGIIPAALLITLCLPQTDAFSQMVIFYDAILVLALVYRFMFTLDTPVHSTSLGMRGYARTLPTVLILGQLLGLLAYILLHSGYQYNGTSFAMVAGYAVIFAVAEETLLRGLIQQRASNILHPLFAAGLSALIGACLSIGTGNIAAFVVAIATGAVMGALYYKKQNLLLTIICNATAKLVYLGLLATFAWNYF